MIGSSRQPSRWTPSDRLDGSTALLDGDRLASRTHALLAAHVPLSLLLDLGDPGGPHSSDLFVDEPASLDWLPAPRRA